MLFIDLVGSFLFLAGDEKKSVLSNLRPLYEWVKEENSRIGVTILVILIMPLFLGY